MRHNSLRARVTAFYVAMLAVALAAFSIAVYVGVKTFLTRSLEKVLSNTAQSITTDYLIPLETKGDAWFLGEITEAYPQGISDPFVRISRAGKVIYQSGDMRDPFVAVSNLPLPSTASPPGSFHMARASSGQQLVIYTMEFQQPHGGTIMVETGATSDPIQHELRIFGLILLGVTPITLLIAAFGGYLLMSRPLRPIVTLTEQAERVGRKELGERLPVIRSGDELERLSLALNRMIDRLEEALAHNYRFSADASHELRTPLTIIRGELEYLSQIPSLPSIVSEGISSALEESSRMSRIVQNLMTISRLDSGGEPLNIEPVDFSGLVAGTIDHMSLLADEKHCALTFTSAHPAYIRGDVMRLKQVVVNLVDNAIQYTPEGGAVRVSVRTEGQSAVLEVADTGIGIPPEALAFVFDRFYRTDQARSRASGGTGLGLSIVRSICVVHDGIASVESEVGHGATFRVELPLFMPAPSELAALKNSLNPSETTASTESRQHKL